MLSIKYNNVATVRLRGKKQAARFEARHHAADLLLCTALEALGQEAIIAAWRKVGKRYV